MSTIVLALAVVLAVPDVAEAGQPPLFDSGEAVVASGTDQQPVLRPNAKIRVTVAPTADGGFVVPSLSGDDIVLAGPEHKLVGHLVEFDTSALTLRLTSGETVRLPRPAIAGIDSMKRRSPMQGIVLGAALGFVAGSLLTRAAGGGCEGWGGGNYCVFVGGLGAAAGALAGGLISSAPRWAPVPLDQARPPSPPAQAIGWRVGVNIRF